MTANQIAYWANVETKRANLMREAQNAASLQETQRSNLAKESETQRSNQAKEFETNRANQALEAINVGRLQEEQRSNLAKEQETNRTNLANESIKDRQLAETVRSNVAQEALKSKDQEEIRRANVARETENIRSNLAKEQETKRSNIAKELETSRSNKAREDETHRTNIANEVIKSAQVASYTVTNLLDSSTRSKAQQENERHNRAMESLALSKDHNSIVINNTIPSVPDSSTPEGTGNVSPSRGGRGWYGIKKNNSRGNSITKE